MGIEFSLALPRDAVGIPMVRRVIGDALRSIGVAQTCISEILLAASEACTNAVRHGAGTRYQVTVAIRDGRCDLRVADSGPGLSRLPDRYPPSHAENGRGILIMQSMADEIFFDVAPGRGTTVHLRKELTWDGDEEATAWRPRELATV